MYGAAPSRHSARGSKATPRPALSSCGSCMGSAVVWRTRTGAHNMCHLDVKTENILLGRPSGSQGCTGKAGSSICWTPKLADFRLALKVDGRTGITYLPASDYRYAQPMTRSIAM